MCSYNLINGAWSCENPDTLANDLESKLGFDGWVMSDWGATHSTVASALAGLDQEMPRDNFFNPDAFAAAIKAGNITQALVDGKVLRILTAMYSIGLFDDPHGGTFGGKITNNVTSVAHNQAARDLAGRGAVLLKNDAGALPFTKASLARARAARGDAASAAGGPPSIAVLGDAGSIAPIVGGTGSGRVTPPYVITALQGIANRAASEIGSDAVVKYAPTGKTPAAAAALAAASDVAVVVVGTVSGEGHDRPTLGLDAASDALVAAAVKANPNTVVVVTSPGAVILPWSGDVKGIVAMFMPGQEMGNAAADVLFGTVNPSGRLPLTFPNGENDQRMTKQQWPGVPCAEATGGCATYTEKLEMGYRWYDAHGVAPRFAFGHGLSFTTFAYSNIQVRSSCSTSGCGGTVTFDVTNSGNVAGKEVAQLYLGFPAAAGEPPQQLKGFEAVGPLAPGQSTAVTFTLGPRDLSIWDVGTHAWAPQNGAFGVFVGASSRDIRVTGILRA